MFRLPPHERALALRKLLQGERNRTGAGVLGFKQRQAEQGETERRHAGLPVGGTTEPRGRSLAGKRQRVQGPGMGVRLQLASIGERGKRGRGAGKHIGRDRMVQALSEMKSNRDVGAQERMRIVSAPPTPSSIGMLKADEPLHACLYLAAQFLGRYRAGAVRDREPLR